MVTIITIKLETEKTEESLYTLVKQMIFDHELKPLKIEVSGRMTTIKEDNEKVEK